MVAYKPLTLQTGIPQSRPKIHKAQACNWLPTVEMTQGLFPTAYHNSVCPFNLKKK